MEKTIRKTRPLVIAQMLKGALITEHSKILEPSAGSGDLIEGILKRFPLVDIDCIELNKELRDTLKSKGYNVIGNDFLKKEPSPIYDYVIACPTYKDNIDVEHIMHMYEFLKPGGEIISLTHPAWTIQNSSRQQDFREWLYDKEYAIKMLQDCSFVENFEAQPSAVIVIYKPKPTEWWVD